MNFLNWFKFSFKKKKKQKDLNIKIFYFIKKIQLESKIQIFQKFANEKKFFFHLSINHFPINYNFEIEKTIKKLNFIKKKKKIFLQFPEGMQKFSLNLIIIFKKHLLFSNNFLFSNRTIFGACCLEDANSKFNGCEILLHYGHSCLNPVLECEVSIFYIFLEIYFEITWVIENLKKKIVKNKKNWNFFSTIQFLSNLSRIKIRLLTLKEDCKIIIPQNKPLSPGEILGCTGCTSKNYENIIYLGDGRFHLESIMLANPHSYFLQYNPFSHFFFGVDFSLLNFLREREFILFKSFFKKKNSALIISSLGRQGNSKILKRFKELSDKKNFNFFYGSIGEISPDKLEFIGNQFIKIWTQIACPRISNDWGRFFKTPFLSIYEIIVILNFTKWNNFYLLMDFYSFKGGIWSNYFNNLSRFLIN
jgi:2-(3-amino-3-carboxypropyl)histidine synthase